MTDDRRRIDVLLERVADADLRAKLTAEIVEITGSRNFGLVFEKHLPEAVRLSDAPVRFGSTVKFREGDGRLWQVKRLRDGTALLVHEDEELHDVPTVELVAARKLGDPVYPGFRQLGRLDCGGDKPHHLIIEGENYHVLQTLQYTHRGKVDLIYIDPPYNTGAGDWIYNDRYIGDNDAYAHSKWLSFMHRRLELAKELLAPTGAIIAAIDDNEHHRLRMLMDQVLGERNFLANITWQGGVKNDSRFSSGGVDYMLMYAKNAQALTASDYRWREGKPGIDEALAASAAAWKASGGDAATATTEYRKWIRANKSRLSAGITEYTNIDSQGRAWRYIPLISPNPRPTLMYTVEHPVTKRPVRTPDNGWNCAESVFWERYASGRIIFGADETGVPRGKIFLDEGSEQSPAPTFTTQRVPATYYLQNLLGSKDFPFPKDVDVVARWVDIVTAHKPAAIVLDFFAGTGTTAEAVMRLNAKDSGRRQAIVVTNNELSQKKARELTKAGFVAGDAEWEAEGVFQKVTRPRVETIVTGVRRNGTPLAEAVTDAAGKEVAKGIAGAHGLDENASFLQLTYLDRDDVELGEAYRQIAELLWAKAGAVGSVIPDTATDFAISEHYAICFDVNAWARFAEVVRGTPSVRVAYIVAGSETSYGRVKRALPEDIEAVHLYENYLTNFEINAGDHA